MIELSGITVAFGGVKPIVDLNLTLDGHIQGLIGPNGAGKTTLLNVLSGFVIPVAGSVQMFGQNFGSIRPEDRLQHRITRSFQTPQVAADLTAAVDGPPTQTAGHGRTSADHRPRLRSDRRPLRPGRRSRLWHAHSTSAAPGLPPSPKGTGCSEPCPFQITCKPPPHSCRARTQTRLTTTR